MVHRIAVAAFFLLFWTPLLYRATSGSGKLPGTPRLLSDMQSLSCLFSEKPNGWSFFYVQAQYPGQTSWTTLDQRELFPLEPFGYRTRLHRYLMAWKRKPNKGTEEAAMWIFGRYEQLHPELPQPQYIRFAWSWTVPDANDPPTGRWKIPEWNSLRADRRKVIGAYERPDD